MVQIRRQLTLGLLALTLAGIVSAQALAQSGPVGPAPAGSPQTPAQPARVVFTKESVPQMLKQLGYTVTDKTAPNGAYYWQIVTQSENWNFTVLVVPQVQQDKITALLLSSDLGRKISPQTSAQDVLKLMQYNREQAFLLFFGYNPQTGCVTAQRPYSFNDASVDEMRQLFNDTFKTIRDTHAVWNALSNAAPAAPAVNGGPAPAPAPQAPASIADSSWTGTENLAGFGKLTFAFHANGTATMIDTSGESKGTWTQNGGEVTINFNGCVYQGRINGQSLSGSARTAGQGGQSWSFQVTLQKN